MKLIRILIVAFCLLPLAHAQTWVPRWSNADIAIHQINQGPNYLSMELWVRYKNPLYYRKITLYCTSARFKVETEQGQVIVDSMPITPSEANIYGLYSDLCLR